MGDRVSISFQQETEWYVKRKKETHMDQSPVLFNHWRGTQFPKFAFQWFKKIKAKYAKPSSGGGDPFTRMEPRNLMVQFIAHLRNHEDLRYDRYVNEKRTTDDELISYSIYLGKTPEDGDNSDNGHYTIDVDNVKMYNDKGESIE